MTKTIPAKSIHRITEALIMGAKQMTLLEMFPPFELENYTLIMKNVSKTNKQPGFFLTITFSKGSKSSSGSKTSILKGFIMY